MQYLAINAMGRDRPGIVAEVTGLLYQQGCNLEDATMTRLRDQFAMLLVVGVPGGAIPALESALQSLADRLDLSLIVRLSPETSAAGPAEKGNAEGYIVRVSGADRPGIVHAVTAALAARRLNITDLHTRVLPNPSGPVYVMLLEIDATPAAQIDDLPLELQRLARELNVEISLEPLDEEAL